MAGAVPKLVRYGLPFVGGGDALAREIVHVLRLLQIGGVCAGPLHHPGQRALIVQQRAGTEQIFRKRLPVVIMIIARRKRMFSPPNDPFGSK